MAENATLTGEQQRERLDVAQAAADEIESIAMHLNANLPHEADYLFLRSMVLRIAQLNDVFMWFLDGDDGDIVEMRDLMKGGLT